MSMKAWQEHCGSADIHLEAIHFIEWHILIYHPQNVVKADAEDFSAVFYFLIFCPRCH